MNKKIHTLRKEKMQRQNTMEQLSSIDSENHTPDAPNAEVSIQSPHPPVSERRRTSGVGVSCCHKNICNIKHFKTLIAGIATLITAFLVAYYNMK